MPYVFRIAKLSVFLHQAESSAQGLWCECMSDKCLLSLSMIIYHDDFASASQLTIRLKSFSYYCRSGQIKSTRIFFIVVLKNLFKYCWCKNDIFSLLGKNLIQQRPHIGTEKMYPSESPKAPSMSEAERKLRVFLNDFKNNPKEYLKYNDITYYTPWSYTLNVSTKRIYFTGAFALTGYQGSREGEKMMNQDVEEILKKGLDYVGESDSYYRSYSWNVEANMTMR